MLMVGVLCGVTVVLMTSIVWVPLLIVNLPLLGGLLLVMKWLGVSGHV